MKSIFTDINNKRIILGSSSIARKKIMGELLLKFENIKSDFKENLDKSNFKSP